MNIHVIRNFHETENIIQTSTTTLCFYALTYKNIFTIIIDYWQDK